MNERKPKVTAWFPCSIKPVRAGLYQIKFNDGSGVGETRHWNGGAWEWARGARVSTSFGRFAGDKWRGLAEQPK